MLNDFQGIEEVKLQTNLEVN